MYSYKDLWKDARIVVTASTYLTSYLWVLEVPLPP